MLSPDNFVQDPYGTQNFNRYGYAMNNPLVYVDENGEFFITAAIIATIIKGAIIGSAVGAVTYTAGVALSDGGFNNWNWGHFAMSVGIGAVNGALSTISPIKVPFGNSSFGLNIAPQIAVGTDGIGLGFNATLGYSMGQFNAGMNFGGTYYAGAPGTGASGFEGRLGYGIGYESAKGFRTGIGSTYFFSGETSQQTGQLYVGGKNWKTTYENDTWAPVPGLLSPGGADRDRYRTVALRFDMTGGRWKGANAGFNIFTGESNGRVDPNGNFVEPGNSYRLGALYVGYGNARIGYNSERNIRGPIQNGFHNLMNYPHFRVLSLSDKIYGGLYSLNPYTLW